MELTKVVNNEAKTMSSIEIAELTGKRHADVMRDARKLESAYTQVYGNERNFALVDYKDKKGETRPMFALTKSQALFVVSGYNAVLRAAIQNRWEELEAAQFNVPTTFKDALLLAAKQQEAIELQAEELKKLEPKVFLHDQLMATHDSVSVADFAKVLHIGRNTLWAKFREYQFMMQGKHCKKPYQKYVDRGLFVLVERTVSYSIQDVRIEMETRITTRGQQYFTNLFVR